MMDIQNKMLWPGWETVRLIGRGSFGAAYEIERDVLGDKEKAALKVITIPQNDSDIEEMYSDGYDDESITNTFKAHLKSIVSEYSLMRKLNGSANVVNCDDVRYVQNDNGFGWDIFIKMELLTPITAALPPEISEDKIIKIGRDLCRALVQCKQFGIIHRDIKPQNIFVSPLGDYKLGDFGIAKTVEKTSGGTKIGTYKYMAPEVYNNQPYGAGADIYSLGLVLYWLLNERRLPFLPLPPEKLRAGMEEEARLRRFRGEQFLAPVHGSEELKSIVLKACAYDSKDRYQSAADMLSDLEELDASKYGRAELITTSTPEPTIEPEQENLTDGTISLFHDEMSDPEDETMGAFPKLEKEPEPDEDKTVGGWTQPESETQSVPKPKNKPKKWLIAVAAALVVIGATVGIGGAGANAKPQNNTISAGGFHTVSLKSDGTVVAVGDNHNGQCEVSGWTDIVAVSANYRQTAGLKSDGTVVVVGENFSGQGDVSGWSDIIAVSAGYWQTVGLKSDGTVVVTEDYYHCDAADWTGIVAVSTGDRYTVGLKSNGTVVVAGNRWADPCDASCWTDIVAVSSGGDHIIGLKSNGTVVAAGNNMNGQCDVSEWTDIVAVSAGEKHTVALKSDGTVVAVGENMVHQCDVSDWTDIVAISAGSRHTVGLKSDGMVVAVGYNTDGCCDVYGWKDIMLPKQ